MVRCKDCKHCEGIDYYIWYDLDGTAKREWIYCCEFDGYLTEITAEEGECPNYVNYNGNDDTTKRA